MADDINITPGSGAVVATDEVGGRHFQLFKPAFGADGAAQLVSPDSPLPAVASRTDDLVIMLSRIVKLLESNAVVDSAQRQRIALDTIPAGVTLPTVTTVTGVTTVTTVTTLANATAIAGMDREQWINAAKSTYAQSIRSRLEFV
jgi:hypothetical protein